MSDPFHPLVEDARSWSQDTFGEAELGDSRRTDRLVRMAETVLRRPAGRVTEVFVRDADRQGAYGLLENSAVTPDAVGEAAFRATIAQLRTRGLTHVEVALDGGSLTLTDRQRRKGTGRVGDRNHPAFGFHVMSALAITREGEPVGLLDQRYWARPARRPNKPARARPLKDKETHHWIDAMEAIERYASGLRDDAAGDATPRCRPRGLLDRGGDCRHVLLKAIELQPRCDFIIRAAWNRRLSGAGKAYLWPTVAGSSLAATYAQPVPAGPRRQVRTAHMEVRSEKVSVRLRDRWNKTVRHAELWAVQAREVGTTPVGEKPIEWMLWTTCAVTTGAEACAIVQAYARRWRIEEFHRAWKRGACAVEETQLRSAAAIQKWATVLAVVAARIVQLSYRARTEPEAPATVALSQDEIDATIVLTQPPEWVVGSQPPLAQVVRWIANLGGYTGKSSGGLPGPTVLARGLRDVEVATRMLRQLRAQKGEREM